MKEPLPRRTFEPLHDTRYRPSYAIVVAPLACFIFLTIMQLTR